jgi:hypothetical protein
MGLLDLFSGTNGRNAAIWSAGTTQGGADAQRGSLNTGANQGLAALGQGYNTARNDIQAASGSAQGVLRDYYQSNAIPYAQQAGAQAQGYFAPLGAEANRGFSAYGDATGVNGAVGRSNARENFQAGPGYEYMVNQGVNAASRAANATGMGASGNTLDATTRLGSNLANQEWGNYINRLNPYLNLAPAIAGQQAGAALRTGETVSGLARDYGRDIAGLQVGAGNTLASLGSGYGSNQAGIYGDLSRNLSNVTGAETAAVTGQGQAGLLAGQTANQNTWNAGLQLANLAAGNAGKVANAFA